MGFNRALVQCFLQSYVSLSKQDGGAPYGCDIEELSLTPTPHLHTQNILISSSRN